MGEPVKFPKAVSSTPPLRRLYEFGPFRLDVAKRLLFRNGQTVALTPKLLETLLVLVQNSGTVVGKDELMTALWPDTVVEEANLTVNVSALRKVLGEGAKDHRYIVTVPGRGYCFVADLKDESEDEYRLALEKQVGADGNIGQPRDKHHSDQLTLSAPGTALARQRAWGFLRSHRLLIGSLLMLAIGLTLYVVLSGNHARDEAGAGFKSIAVLPLKVLGGDGTDVDLGVGMADSLITRLGSLKRIIVRPIGSVLKYNRLEQDPAAAGRELKVDAVLEGSIRKSGGTVRVTVRLVSAEGGAQLWASKFDENASDVFTVEDHVSARVSEAFRLNLTSEERKRLARRYTENTEAYEAYLKGRALWARSRLESIKEAIEYFQKAIRIDPDYALAYAGLADSYSALGNARVGMQPPGEVMPQAKAAALKALELDDALAEAHASLGSIRMRYDYDWPSAESEFKRALELNPSDAMLHHWYGNYLSARGRHDEAISEIERAKQLDPASFVIASVSGMFLFHACRYDEAINACRDALEMEPGYPHARGYLGAAYEQKGMYEEAIVAFQKNVEANREMSLQPLGHAYAMAGKRGEALKILDEMKKLSRRRYLPPYYLAVVYTGLGDKTHAIDWLEKAYQERSGALIFINVDPRFNVLRLNSRFLDLMRRMGFAQ